MLIVFLPSDHYINALILIDSNSYLHLYERAGPICARLSRFEWGIIPRQLWNQLHRVLRIRHDAWLC